MDKIAFGLFTLLLVYNIHNGHGVNLEEMTACFLREYRFRASKPYVTKTGHVLPCSDIVTVSSCWGRCDSSEIADYKMPFKISNHPVCSYDGLKARRVVLRNCHPQHPDPSYIVYDAVRCACQKCNPEYTSCENLNG